MVMTYKQYLTVVYHCCVSRNAEASPRTRHVQLLLPVPWSRAHHTTAGMVSHRRARAKASTVDSCKQGAITIPSFRIRGARTLCSLCVLNGAVLAYRAAYAGRSASGCSCCAAVASATPLLCVPSTCQTHRHIRAPA